MSGVFFLMVRFREAIQERTIYNYSYLYQASLLSLKNAQEKKYGNTYNYLISIIMLAFTFEAYLNHCGEHVIEHWDDIERIKTISKLNIITKTLKINLDKSKKPYRTIKDLIKIRNMLAHARTEILTSKGDRYPDSEWEKNCNAKVVRKYFSSVEEIIKKIHNKAFGDINPFIILSTGISK